MSDVDDMEYQGRAELVEAMHGLTESFVAVGTAFTSMSERFDADRKFRRIVMSVLSVLVVISLATGAAAAVAVVGVRNSAVRDKTESCLRGHDFRSDLYTALDGILDKLEAAVDSTNPKAAKFFKDAKAGVREDVPQRECN